MKLAPPPEFVRNVSGSSAGAGSGEFHVYRALRRKEQTRVKMMEEEASKVGFLFALNTGKGSFRPELTLSVSRN